MVFSLKLKKRFILYLLIISNYFCSHLFCQNDYSDCNNQLQDYYQLLEENSDLKVSSEFNEPRSNGRLHDGMDFGKEGTETFIIYEPIDGEW